MSEEVRPGYKRTEVGVIPEDWEVSSVGREFEVKLGKMLDAEKNVGVPKPYLGNKAIQWDRIDTSELQTVPMTRADIERFRLRKGDLLVCEGGEVGRAAIWQESLEECYYQKALHRLRPTRGFNVQVMAALLRHWSDRSFLTNYVTQTSIAHLPREKFMEIPMPVPPPVEQSAIAEALSDVDALLDVLDRLIAKKRDLKQAAMQQLLTGQTRLPGFHGEWESVKAGDVGYFRGGNGFPTKFQGGVASDYPFYKVSDMNNDGNDTFMLDSNNWISEGVRKHLGATTFPNESIIFAKVGVAIFLERKRILKKQSCIDNNLAALVLDKSRAHVRFVHYSLLNIKFGAFVNTTALPSLSGSVLARITFALPPLAEQIAIAAVLSDIDAELNAFEQRREKTQALKQGMMQELLTGKTRLLDPGGCHA